MNHDGESELVASLSSLLIVVIFGRSFHLSKLAHDYESRWGERIGSLSFIVQLNRDLLSICLFQF